MKLFLVFVFAALVVVEGVSLRTVNHRAQLKRRNVDADVELLSLLEKENSAEKVEQKENIDLTLPPGLDTMTSGAAALLEVEVGHCKCSEASSTDSNSVTDKPASTNGCMPELPFIKGIINATCCEGLICKLSNGICCEGGSHCCPGDALCVQGDPGTPPACLHHPSPERTAQSQALSYSKISNTNTAADDQHGSLLYQDAFSSSSSSSNSPPVPPLDAKGNDNHAPLVRFAERAHRTANAVKSFPVRETVGMDGEDDSFRSQVLKELNEIPDIGRKVEEFTVPVALSSHPVIEKQEDPNAIAGQLLKLDRLLDEA